MKENASECETNDASWMNKEEEEEEDDEGSGMITKFSSARFNIKKKWL